MKIQPIKTEAEYRNVLKEIDSLFVWASNTPKGRRLKVLLDLVEAYENIHYPIDLPNPNEALLYHLESRK